MNGGPARDAPLVSVVVPAFNEADVIADTLERLVDHLRTLEPRFRWEIVVVDDGSTDPTADLAEKFAAGERRVRVLRHRVNFRLGQALRYAFGQTEGDFVAVIDCDLSYSPDHITRMLHTAQETGARVVVASPYMKGGSTTAVPFLRRVTSRGANRLLGAAAGGGLTTLTGMVRVYDGPFLRNLDLRAVDSDINVEIIYKAQILHARVVEVPAHLDWSFAATDGRRRTVGGRVRGATVSSLFSSFLFRPFLLFGLAGLVLAAAAGGAFGWAVANDGTTAAYLVAGVFLLGALLLVGLGVVAAQAKRYFEELYHLGTSVLRRSPGRRPLPDDVLED